MLLSCLPGPLQPLCVWRELDKQGHKKGRTPLDMAARHWHEGLVELLKKHRAKEQPCPAPRRRCCGVPKHMTLHKFAEDSILAVCHESSDTNPDEVFGRDADRRLACASCIGPRGITSCKKGP